MNATGSIVRGEPAATAAQKMRQEMVGNYRVMTRGLMTANLCYTICQTIEDMGGIAEIYVYGNKWCFPVKTKDEAMGGKARYIFNDEFGGTDSDAPAFIAAETFKESPHPGKVFITITDGDWPPDMRRTYAKLVDRLNAEGVKTVFFGIGRQAKAEIERATDMSTRTGDKKYLDSVAVHHQYAYGSATVDGFMDRLPAFIQTLHQSLVSKALRGSH